MSKSRQPHNGPKGQPNGKLSARAQGTWPQQRSSKAQRAAKAARVHTLTDPLGAKGFRTTGPRVRHETSARRTVLLASVATFAASFGIIIGTSHLPTHANSGAAANQPAASTSNGSSIGSAADLFPGQTANGLTGSTASPPTATVRPTQPSLVSGERDDGERNASSQTTQPSSNSSSQSSLFLPQQPSVQQPSHTRSGGS